MPTLPVTTDSPLVRTSYRPGSAAHWGALQEILATPQRDNFRPYLSYVDQRAWDGASASELAHAAHTIGGNYLVAFIADDTTLSDAGRADEYPVLVVEISAERPAGDEARTTRCVARELWCPENNLNLANMNWEEWVAGCEAEGGTYRGLDMDRHEAEVKARQEQAEAEGRTQPPPMLLGSKRPATGEPSLSEE